MLAGLITMIRFLCALNKHDWQTIHVLSRKYRTGTSLISLTCLHRHFTWLSQMGIDVSKANIAFRQFLNFTYGETTTSGDSSNTVDNMVLTTASWYPIVEHLTYALRGSAQRRELSICKLLASIPDPRGRILDVGTGPGVLLTHACKAWPGSCFTAVDINLYCLLHAKALVEYQVPNAVVQYMHGNAIDLPLEADSVDMALAIEVIEHVQNPHAILEELARVVKCGGYIICGCPINLPAPTHQYVFSKPDDCFLMAKECGLQLLKHEVLKIDMNSSDVLAIFVKP